jgi:putative transposase
MLGLTEYYPQFFTATILEWKHLLKPDKYKDIVVNSLDFLVENNRVAVYGFVIMPNHIHLIWQMAENHERENIQRDFLKYTAQQIKFDLIEYHSEFLEQFRVNAKDRNYQIWERNPLSIDIWCEKVMLQKLNYIHYNPVQPHWNLCKEPVDYRYSSAGFYETGKTEWKFLTHYLG